MKTLYILLIPFLFTLASCGDPCDEINCLNGGTCIDGTCDCPPGFGADNCGREEIPQSVTIQELHITSLPATKPDGSSWDLFGGAPDVFAVIRINGMIEAYTELVTNASGGVRLLGGTLPLTRTTDFGDDIRIEVYDDDGSDSDLIGGYVLPDFYALNQGFPETRIAGSGNALTVELRYTYVH
jgi:hypothetical protein